MSAEIRSLPVSTAMAPGEAIDGYLERLAAVNGMTHPELARRLAGARTTYLVTAPEERVVAGIAALSTHSVDALRNATLATLPGIDAIGLDPNDRTSWRRVAARGWPPEHGSALCPTCMAEDGIWRLAWRHPWTTACVRHGVWLAGTCPSCLRRFRSHRTPLRSVDAPAGTCGNPAGTRGRNCLQPLDAIAVEPAPASVLDTQQRIDTAIAGEPVRLLGDLTEPSTYLQDLRSLTVLLLHLAIQPAASQLVEWVDLASADHARTTGNRGARWGLAPPRDLVLRGSALAAADAILRRSVLEAAAEALHPWTELTPATNDGQLGWLADHTTMTPTLTRLVMAATARRRRVANLLDHSPPSGHPVGAAIPQVLPADLFAAHIAGMLDVADRTGRLYAALCLARRHSGARTWAAAATALGLPAETGEKAARACSADLLVRPDAFVAALDGLAEQLDTGVDYRARESAVRHLADTTGWYRPWARTHHPGSHDVSSGYAVTWLWTEDALGHLDTSPAWRRTPDYLDRARYRRYTGRLTTAAKDALIVLAGCVAPGGRRTA